MLSSPLRYPGGKAKLYQYFAEIIKKNELYSSHYYEPYAGGAGLALKLLSSGFVSRITLNDIDRGIVSVWRAILRNTDEFCRLIDNTEVSVREWKRQRAIWLEHDSSDPLSLGFATYFLNRTNRSGIIEGAGPIGGHDQTGKWKIDARFNKDMQIANIREIAKFSRLISISNVDATTLVRRVGTNSESLIYLDPPYYVKGSSLYKNFYVHEDHLNIARYLKRIRRRKWVVSYDNAPEIRDMYSSFQKVTHFMTYSAGPKLAGKEIMFVSDPLEVPAFSGFTRASART